MKWIANLFKSRVARMIDHDDPALAIDLIANDPSELHRIAAASVIARWSSRICDKNIRYTNINLLLIHLCFDRSAAVARACLDAAYQVDPAFTEAQLARARSILGTAGLAGLRGLLGYAPLGTPGATMSPQMESCQVSERLAWHHTPRAPEGPRSQDQEEQAVAPVAPGSIAVQGKYCAACGAATSEEALQCQECGFGRLVSPMTPPAERSVRFAVDQCTRRPSGGNVYPAASDISVYCPKCGQRYTLLKDALVVTASGVLNDFGARTVFGDAASGPDLIAACDAGVLSRNYAKQVAEVEQIRRDIASRRWTCQRCGVTYGYR